MLHAAQRRYVVEVEQHEVGVRAMVVTPVVVPVPVRVSEAGGRFPPGARPLWWRFALEDLPVLDGRDQHRGRLVEPGPDWRIV